MSTSGVRVALGVADSLPPLDPTTPSCLSSHSTLAVVDFAFTMLDHIDALKRDISELVIPCSIATALPFRTYSSIAASTCA